jgi:DNA-binding transcriptional regulator PaaX
MYEEQDKEKTRNKANRQGLSAAQLVTCTGSTDASVRFALRTLVSRRLITIASLSGVQKYSITRSGTQEMQSVLHLAQMQAEWDGSWRFLIFGEIDRDRQKTNAQYMRLYRLLQQYGLLMVRTGVYALPAPFPQELQALLKGEIDSKALYLFRVRSFQLGDSSDLIRQYLGKKGESERYTKLSTQVNTLLASLANKNRLIHKDIIMYQNLMKAYYACCANRRLFYVLMLSSGLSLENTVLQLQMVTKQVIHLANTNRL